MCVIVAYLVIFVYPVMVPAFPPFESVVILLIGVIFLPFSTPMSFCFFLRNLFHARNRDVATML